MSRPVSVTAVGMACPLGLSAPAACAAIRANINQREDLPYSDEDGEPIVGSALSLLPHHIGRRQRWIALAACSLQDLMRDSLPALATVPLLLVTSDASTTSEAIRRELSAALGLELSPQYVRVVVGGPALGLHLLAQARELVGSQEAEACVVLAADSLIDAAALLGLARTRRLVVSRNPDGLCPGEAAACVLVQASTQTAWGHIRGLGNAREPARLDNDAAMRAEGLTRASQAALEQAGYEAHQLSFRVSDATGESFYFKEQALLPARLLRQPIAQFPLWVPAA